MNVGIKVFFGVEVMDCYMEVKGKTEHAETLWTQFYEIRRRQRMKMRGERVSLYWIKKHITPVMEVDAECFRVCAFHIIQ